MNTSIKKIQHIFTHQGRVQSSSSAEEIKTFWNLLQLCISDVNRQHKSNWSSPHCVSRNVAFWVYQQEAYWRMKRCSEIKLTLVYTFSESIFSRVFFKLTWKPDVPPKYQIFSYISKSQVSLMLPNLRQAFTACVVNETEIKSCKLSEGFQNVTHFIHYITSILIQQLSAFCFLLRLHIVYKIVLHMLTSQAQLNW